MNYITFDIETYTPGEDMKTAGRGKIDTSKMKVSTIGAYYSWLDEYIVFFENDVEDFIDSLKHADFLVGYNHIWFDLPVLQKYAKYDLKSLKNYDILLEIEKVIGFKLRLNDLAKANLTITKTDSFEQFRTYHLEEKWHELSYYCIHDVKMTQQLFEMILQGKTLTYADMLQDKTFTLPLPDLTLAQHSQNTTISVEELF